MAVSTSIPIGQLSGQFRLDAEFYQSKYIEVEAAVQALPHRTLGDTVKSLRKGVFNILADSYVDSGVPFYRSSNVGDIIPRDGDVVFISADRHAKEWRTALRRGDIMLAKTGRPAASIVLTDECNVSQDVVAIVPDRSVINPFYLATFLNTDAGRLQMERWFQGQVQLHLSLPDARQIIVPLASRELQQRTEDAILVAERNIVQSRVEMEAAEAAYLRAAGLDVIPGADALTYEKSYSALRDVGRLDAEYFKPRREAIRTSLGTDGLSISSVAKVTDHRFNARDFADDQTIRYIEIGSLNEEGEALPDELPVAQAPSRARFVVQPGDVITSLVRPIRRLTALVTQAQRGAVCSSGFAVLEALDRKIEPEVLFTFLRLGPVCELLDLNTTATMYPAISIDRLLGTPIIVPSAPVRAEIVHHVRSARELARRARCNLAEAKADVSAFIGVPEA